MSQTWPLAQLPPHGKSRMQRLIEHHVGRGAATFLVGMGKLQIFSLLSMKGRFWQVCPELQSMFL